MEAINEKTHMDNPPDRRKNEEDSLKRKRKANWSDGESLLLVQLYKENCTVLKADFKSNIRNRQRKDAWEYITSTINETYRMDRTQQEVTKRWFTILSRSKKALCDHNKNTGATGKYSL